MGAALQGLTDVARQRANVRTLGADHADGDLRVFLMAEFATQQFYFVNAQGLGFEFNVFSLARQVIGALAVYLAGRECGRYLHDFSNELRKDLPYGRFGDVCGREGGVNVVLEVKARCGGSETQRGYVFFHASLQLFYLFGGPTGAYNHYARSQRVECAGMAYFDFFSAHAARQQPAHFGHQAERCHAQWFFECQYLSCQEIHRPNIRVRIPAARQYQAK